MAHYNFEFFNKVEKAIHWGKPVEEQLEALSQFDDITVADIQEMAATCHKSAQAGILLEYLGYERLKPYSPLFLEFLQDMNWCGGAGAATMLTKAGKEIIPEIQRVFKEVANDAIWHYWILLGIVQRFDKDLILILKSDLLALIQRADKEGAAIQALVTLKESALLTEKEVLTHYHYLLKKYEGDPYWIEDLNEALSP